jgi:hypothetical protein
LFSILRGRITMLKMNGKVTIRVATRYKAIVPYCYCAHLR